MIRQKMDHLNKVSLKGPDTFLKSLCASHSIIILTGHWTWTQTLRAPAVRFVKLLNVQHNGPNGPIYRGAIVHNRNGSVIQHNASSTGL